MKKEEFLQKISNAKDMQEISEIILDIFLEKELLEQRNEELKERIKELEYEKSCIDLKLH